jgi:hypothetical protein
MQLRGPGSLGKRSLRWDLHQRATALAMHSSTCTGKLQTRPLVREGATRGDSRNCQIIKRRLKSGHLLQMDLLCSLIAADKEVPGSILCAARVFWVAVGLQRGPLNLVRINEQLHESKVATPF